MVKKKITLDALAQTLARMDAHMRKGFASIDKQFTSLDARVERGFAATADDIAHMATKHDLMAAEKRLVDRIDGVRIKVDGLQNERDAEALQRRDQKIPERLAKLEEKVFGNIRA
jgi:uncharacterized membrane protein YccC